MLLALMSLSWWSGGGDKLDVLVVMASRADVYYPDVENTARAWAVSHDLEVTVTAPDAPLASVQQRALESMLEKRWDVICVEPLGVAELSPLLESAKDNGSVIVTLRGGDFPVADYNLEPFSHEEMGERMMEALAKGMNSGGSYMTLVPSHEDENIISIEEAAANMQKRNYAGIFPAARLAATNGDASRARDIVQGNVERHAINGLLFFTTKDGLGVAGQMGADGKKIFSVGMGDPVTLQKCLDEKNIGCVFYWSRENMFLAGMEIGRSAARGRGPDAKGYVSLPLEGYETVRNRSGNTWVAGDIRMEYPGNK
jgi:simple sugar transport system substrate-binding protein/rhamnose transport system substrate-binding protein